MVVSGNNTLRVVKYAFLPQILPRIATLFFSGFSFFAYFVAQVYGAVRLLPKGHPYLNSQNVGHFSVPDVVGAAGRSLKYRKENIDQIIIFYVILLGLFLLAIQVFVMAMSLVMPQAMALSLSYYFGSGDGSVFGDSIDADSSQDLAFILLDRVFGVPDIFNSCVANSSIPCYRSTSSGTFNTDDTVYTPTTFPWPFHEALHSLYEFYSVGLLIVALFIVLYFVVVLVAETAQTGVPFGKRFNSVWAPLRLVIAIGLLIPVGSYGLNAAQYIVLYAAKFGSNFATNGWIVFNTELASGHLATGIVAKPQKPEVVDLLRFMMLAHACKALEEGYMKTSEKPPAGVCGVDDKDETDTIINAYLVRTGTNVNDNSALLEKTTYENAVKFFDNSDMTIRFGDRGCTEDHNKEKGNVQPLCGELTLSAAALKDVGATTIQEGYYDLVRHLWGAYSGRVWENNGFCDKAKVDNVLGGANNKDFENRSLFYVQQLCPQKTLPVEGSVEPDAKWINEMVSGYKDGDVCNDSGFDGSSSNYVGVPSGTSITKAVIIENIIRKGIYEEVRDIQGLVTSSTATSYQIPMDLLARGWAGAGMWYNQIAKINGAVSGAAWKAPEISRWPLIQTNILVQKRMNDQGSSVAGATSTSRSSTTTLETERGPQELHAGGALYKIDMAWMGASLPLKPKTGNTIFNAINWLFGTQGLFDLRDPVNQSADPLSLMTALGKGLVEASIRNLGLALGGQIGQIFVGDELGPMLGGGASMLYTIATMTLTAGFLLYYVLPFFPFVYFFFAVGNWVKGIFEALVGVPLWALAHIRIDGDGLPGSAALNGYFLIFEIFIRPILIVFGLLAAVSIFSAMAIVFNSVFELAVYNVGGVNLSKTVCPGTPTDTSLMEMVRGPVDQFFYTVMYAVVMYIMALSSFKLIDLIPNKIMRWMGAQVDTFADMAGDPAQSLTNYAAIGGSQMTESMIGSLRGGVGALGKGVEGIKKLGG